jgi:hypothetical protein
MFDIKMDTIKKLLEAGIPVDDYAKAADLSQDYDFEESGDPVKDFKAMILMLNKEAALTFDLAHYCERYQVKHIEPDPLEVHHPDDQFDIDY